MLDLSTIPGIKSTLVTFMCDSALGTKALQIVGTIHAINTVILVLLECMCFCWVKSSFEFLGDFKISLYVSESPKIS